MGGYIGARAGSLSTTTVANVQDVTATDTTPEVTIINNTHEDTDGGREGKVIFKGQQSGGEESTLAEIQGSHDGTADDEKGDLIFRTNDGSDGASPTERVRIDSNGSILTATLGTDNVHLGEGAGASIASGGNNNVVIGKNAGTSLTTGDNNTAIGHQALDASDTAGDNTAIGSGALSSITSGGYNTAVGRNSFANATTENRNVGLGIETGFDTVTGTQNTFIGSYAGMDNTANYSTSVGDAAGSSATSGGYNTFIGQQAGNAVSTGSKNTVIGRYNGNQGGLDIRTSNNNLVLSDGDGNPLINVHANYIRVAQTQALSDIADHSSGIFRSERGSVTSSGDADDFKTSGFYRFDQNASNLPATNTFFAMVIFGNSGNVVTQIAVQLQATTSYVRSFNAAWSSWARLDT
jgi:hypothetical protein|tara:strand:- start:1104 stop:2327 length:1224 start_codon:yes stop_codon:yes gene_type:complete